MLTGCRVHHTYASDVDQGSLPPSTRVINQEVLRSGINAAKKSKLLSLYTFVEWFYYKELPEEEKVDTRFAIYNAYEITKSASSIILMKNDMVIGLAQMTRSTGITDINLNNMLIIKHRVHQFFDLDPTDKMLAYIFGHINSFYINKTGKNGHKVFTVTGKFTKEIQSMWDEQHEEIEAMTDELEVMRKKEKVELTPIYHKYCFTDCEYSNVCHSGILEASENSTTPINLNRVQWKDKIKLLESGVVKIDNTDILVNNKINVTDARRMQITSGELDIFQNKRFDSWASGLKHPINFLDFETYQQIIPRIAGTKAYDQIPFLFCNNIQTEPFGDDEAFPTLDYHFVEPNEIDGRWGFARALANSCDNNGTVVVYNKAFELGVIDKLIDMMEKDDEENETETHTSFVEKLKSIKPRILDFMDVFRIPGPMFYTGMQLGSFSIKKTYPSVMGFSQDENPYKKLAVPNGGVAMDVYAAAVIKSHDGYDPSRITRRHLVEYCTLDVTSMTDMVEALMWKSFDIDHVEDLGVLPDVDDE